MALTESLTSVLKNLKKDTTSGLVILSGCIFLVPHQSQNLLHFPSYCLAVEILTEAAVSLASCSEKPPALRILVIASRRVSLTLPNLRGTFLLEVALANLLLREALLVVLRVTLVGLETRLPLGGKER